MKNKWQINFKDYLKRGELIKYLAFYPISWNRYTRINEYFKTRTLSIMDYPDDADKHYYGCLKFSSGETYIDFLERINLIQSESQLLSLPNELENIIEDVFIKNHSGHNAIEMPGVLEYPFIISGKLENKNFNKIEQIEGIKSIIDPMGVYIPILNIIVIDQEEIARTSNKIKWTNKNIEWPNYSAVYEFVLRHELSHWISHEMLVKGEPFNDNSFLKIPVEIHEFWAQLFAFNLLDTETQRFMNLLADDHPDIYQAYKNYVDDLSFLQLRDLLIRRNEITNIKSLHSVIKEIQGTVI